MKKIITYGTFDLLHNGHINILKQAKALGDYLIVGVTTDKYDKERGKLNIHRSLIQRIEDVRNTGYADEIIIEEYEGQKIDDILKYNIDTFVIGSDWIGKFDYLKEYCNVVYLERTKNISSTQLRNEKQSIVQLGIIGSGRIAHRFIPESKYVSGINVKGIYNPNIESVKLFSEKHELEFYSSDFNEFLDKVSAVYIASPHHTHAQYIRECLQKKKHVLCEKPMVLSTKEAEELYALAKNEQLILKEAIKTAYCPGFIHLVSLIKSGVIGTVKDIDASFTKLTEGNLRELDATQKGGSITELASYVLLPIVKILGTKFLNVQFISHIKNDIDLFTRGIIKYNNACASFKVGLGVKTEGNLVISGTKGYAYVPAPWWKTEYFELRYEDTNNTRKYFYKFEGDGLRYEINDFIQQIFSKDMYDYSSLKSEESISIIRIIENFIARNNVYKME